MRLYYNGNGILLTGDAESSIENAMTLTWNPVALENVNSESLDQLQDRTVAR